MTGHDRRAYWDGPRHTQLLRIDKKGLEDAIHPLIPECTNNLFTQLHTRSRHADAFYALLGNLK